MGKLILFAVFIYVVFKLLKAMVSFVNVRPDIAPSRQLKTLNSATENSTKVFSVADEIKKLSELNVRGVLSDDEFKDHKKRLLETYSVH